MAPSEPNPRRGDDTNNSQVNTEPFPSIQVTSDNGTTSTTTTTTVGPTITTTTTYPSRGGRPYTVTSSSPSSYVPSPTPASPVIVSQTITPVPSNSNLAGPAAAASTAPPLVSRPTVNRIRPIGIRRLPSSNLVRVPTNGSNGDVSESTTQTSRRGRSSSAPQHYLGGASGTTNNLTRQTTRNSTLAPVVEHLSTGDATPDRDTLNVPDSTPSRRRSVSNAARSVMSRFSDRSRERDEPEYDDQVVDLLDVLDPEVSTLTTLTNVQNSLFVPDLGRWLNRRPTYELSSRRSTVSRRPEPGIPEKDSFGMSPIQSEPTHTPAEEQEPLGTTPSIQRTWSWQRKPQIERTHSISSVVSDSHYAVLPHGVSLEGWSDEDKEALDDHVRHMLHSKRSKFKQRMVAFGKYVRKPLGFFVTLYAVLITLFGLAWVLFLIGWIYVGDRQLYIINIIDNVLVALFAIVGDGLAPFRAVDTYHMIYIAHYHHLTWRLRREQALPTLHDHNDLPAKVIDNVDPEAQKAEDAEYSVLTLQQQQKLVHHQAKFSKSHSFYKPHETPTHYAFPLRLLVAIVVLLDCHSLFQIALGACTWGISYHYRPEALTATILSCSITVNITAGILISVGDRKTRKKDVALRMMRQDLTSTAMKKVEKHKKDRAEQLRTASNQENFEVIDEETADQVKPRSP
ncbi:hypothetical protein PV10_04016 [Exophiala mesophila]|uniref:Integral membrane protein n=1 Tax=Exophiala mesophila TaxID=212818 RepID=A0A0D1WU31_EXOME|nr:uncharacterized protein PV10_04016 [Exophiala mesophila]KIV92745.1 hypothetical protein PV10_04016 [Exophiala mesophila]